MVLHFTCHMLWSTGGPLYTVVSLGAKSRIVIIKVACRARTGQTASLKNGQIFFAKYMANDDFFDPPRRTDSKNRVYIFCRFLGLDHLRGMGVSLGRILGVPSIEPVFWGEGGV